jgi:hypothetical protein
MLFQPNIEQEMHKDENIFHKACQWLTQEKDLTIQVLLVRVLQFFSNVSLQYCELVFKNGMMPFLLPLIKKANMDFVSVKYDEMTKG